MIDCVASLHTNPWTSGMAKFGQQLARRLRVPFVAASEALMFRHPLWSVRASETLDLKSPATYSLFLHDVVSRAEPLVRHATRVYAANAEIARACRLWRPDTVLAWCPSLLQGDASRGAYRVLCYGMASKTLTHLERYRALQRRLDAQGEDYTVSFSTGWHEGMSWLELDQLSAALRAIFGPRLRLLGYLADDALAREMEEADLIALMYEPAVRANNTTYWSAVESGRSVLVCRDADSPGPTDRGTWAGLLEMIRADP